MIAILSAAIAPAIALMAYFYLRDYYTEPLTLIIRTFIFGALLVFPLMFVQYTFKTELFLGSFVHAFIITGLTEEFFLNGLYLCMLYINIRSLIHIMME